MTRTPRRLLLWLPLCLGGLAFAAQSVPDLRLAAGQTAQGEISFDGEEDRVEVDLIAGSKLTFTAKASKKSPLRPTGDVYDPAGVVQTIVAPQRSAKPASVTIKAWTVPATGTYRIGVRGTAAGPTGLYDLTTSATAAPKPPVGAGAISVAGETDEIAFDAPAGSTATLTMKNVKGAVLVPRIVALVGPGEQPVPIQDALRKSTDKSDSLKGIVLPAFGRYRVAVHGNGASTGGYTLAIALKAPKAVKTKLDFRGASGGELTAGAITSIAIVPPSVVLDAGRTLQLSARATYADGRVRDATRSVTWSARNRNVLTVGNGTACGLATGVAAGGTTVEAWTRGAEARAALALVGGATVTSVDVVPSAPAVAAGETIALQAAATFSSGDPADVTGAADWAAAGGVAVALSGSRVTGGAAAGVASITASVGGRTSPARDVTVAARRVERIAVAPAYAEIAGGTRAFTATATYSDGTTGDVTASASWASDDLAAATMSGAIAAFVAPGTAGIRATLGGVSSRPSVLNCGPVALLSVTLRNVTAVPLGAERAFTADGAFADGGTRDVTEAASWASASTSVMTVSTAPGRRGRVTGAAAAGTSLVSATLVASSGSRAGQASASAAASERASIVVVPRIATLASGASAQFGAFVTRTDGTIEDVTATAAWTSSNAAVGTVAGGSVTGVADGGTSVAASIDGLTAHAVALVGIARLTGVAVVPPADAAIGDSRSASARATFAPGGGGDPAAPLDDAASWFSSDPVGLPASAAGVVSARLAGPATFVAAFGGVASPAESASAVAAAERTLRIFPQAAKALPGTDVQLAAQLAFSDGTVVDVASESSWTSATPAAATVGASTGLVHAVAKGTSSISAARGALNDAQTFTSLADAPTISNVSPPTLVRGAAGAVVTIDGENLGGTGLAVSFGGTGVTADAAPTPNGAGTQATVPVSVSGTATLGAHDVTYTTSSGSATRPGAISVLSVTPTIASISPTNIDVPGSGSAGTTLTVNGSGFAAGDAFTLGALAGVTVSGVSVVNSTTMTGLVTVASTTQKARIDVTVTQSAGAGGQTATLANALKIGPPDPTVTSFTPSYVIADGRTVSGQIAGTNFNAGIVASFTGVSGVVSNLSFTRQSPALITFQCDVPGGAAPGAYDLVLQNSNDIPRTFAGRFVVAPRDATIVSFSAASLSRGVLGAPVEVTGTNFRSGDTLVASGTGVTFSGVTVVSAERLTANAGVAVNAALSLRDVAVVHAANVGGRSGTLRNAFRVADAAPSVASCSPATLGRTGPGGVTRRVPVTVTGTNFCAGATVAFDLSGGSGLTVITSPATVVSDTALVVEVDVAANTNLGAWNVKVTNPASLGDSGASGNAKLAIVPETTLCVNRVVAGTGTALGGNQVTIYGSGFLRGCKADFGTQTAAGAQYIDRNTLVCTVPPPANPAGGGSTSNSRTDTTFVDVKVTNAGGANATLTGGYGYLANTTVFRILQSYPADGSTGVPQNLKSAVVRLTDHAKTDTAVVGTTQGTNCQWFESGGVRPTGPIAGFGADRRFLVFSRTSGGNLAAISLPPNTGKYVLETPTALKSAAGTPLTPSKLAQTLTYDQWLFTITTSATDTTAPTLVTAVPAASATNVTTNVAISQTFSEEIDPLTVTTGSITLSQGVTNIPCAISLSNDIRTVTLTPYLELATNTTYTVSIAATVTDLFGNGFAASSRTFTTDLGNDTSAPTVDTVVFEEIASDMDGAGTYVSGTDTPAVTGSTTQAYDLYLPRSGWKIVVNFSDTGGAGVDETLFSAKSSVALASAGPGAELASRFAVSSNRAEWTVASADAFNVGEDVTLTFVVTDKNGNASSQKIVTFDVVDINATALGAGGGNLGPFDTRETWVLRFDRDVYTAMLSYATGTFPPTATQQCTTAAIPNGVADIEESMRISGLATANMTTDAANTVNGPSVGTNAIVVRLLEERLRATLRARYGIGEDGSRGPGAMDIEFLLPGEQGSLSAPPVWSSASSGSSGKAFSEMDIGGDTGPNSSLTGSFSTIGYSFIDARNRNREADMNGGFAAGANEGIFGINMAKSVMNSSLTGTTWGGRVLKYFQAAKGGVPIGEDALDDDVLSDAYDRTSASASNTQAMKDRYDRIMDAIENAALSTSSVVAHEIGHALGLVPDGGPKTGLFGNAPRANTFTEATSTFPNTPNHLNAIGNDVMSSVSSVDQRSATGSDFMRFSAYDRNHLLHRQVFDEGR